MEDVEKHLLQGMVAKDKNGVPLPCAAPDCPYERTCYPDGCVPEYSFTNVAPFEGAQTREIVPGPFVQYHPECAKRLGKESQVRRS